MSKADKLAALLAQKQQKPAEGESAEVRSTSYEDVMRPVFGSVEGERIIAKPIAIVDIYPDSTQPRRAIPSEIRHRWNGEPSSLTELIRYWRIHIGDDNALVTALLEGDDSDWESTDDLPPIVQSLAELAKLASSIARDGLANPISVVGRDKFQIETGERRWLAYHLLYQHTGEGRWSFIPARIVEKIDRWRQAAENSARQDLNAIGRARQYSVLMMALHPERSFLSYEQSASDRSYYAQALDLRVPHGKGELILTAMGLKHRSALSDYRTLLELDDQMWSHADDHNWSIRQLLGVPNNSVLESAAPTQIQASEASLSTAFDPEAFLRNLMVKRQRRVERDIESAHKAGGVEFVEQLINAEIRALEEYRRKLRS